MNIRKIFTLLFILAFLQGYSQTTAENQILKTFHSISSNEILGFAEELSSPKYKGRLSGSPEYMLAADWCAQKFREWGIQPANNDSYFQYFPNEYSEVYSKGSVIYSSGKGKKWSSVFPTITCPVQIQLQEKFQQKWFMLVLELLRPN
jgi:hypothetical protein